MTLPKRGLWLLAATLFVTLAMPSVSVFDSTDAQAQTSENGSGRGYTPCMSGQDIDLLVMMDASGSLNARGGSDPSGERRSEALLKFRNRLSDLIDELASDQDTANVDVRLGLWRFDTDASRVVGFRPISREHPSEEAIEDSLGLSDTRGNTDYGKALSAAQEALSRQPDACRLLLFFTDGLHDPADSDDPEERASQSLSLLAHVCRALKGTYENAGINTYAVLIGRFEAGQAITEADRAARTPSMQSLRILTGHADSPLVAGLSAPALPDCARHRDIQPEDRAGSIVAATELEVLADLLFEAVDTAIRGLVPWPYSNCGLNDPASAIPSGHLPAGKYIEIIAVYPRGGKSAIPRYEIITSDGEERAPPNPSTPLYLDERQLGDLEAGWQLKIEGSVACYVNHRRDHKPVQVEGNLVGADPQELTAGVVRSAGDKSAPKRGLRLRVVEAPLGRCIAAEADAWPAALVDGGWYCPVEGKAEWSLKPLPCNTTHDLGGALRYRIEPIYTAELFGAGEVIQAVQINVNPDRLTHDCTGQPYLKCADDNLTLRIEPDTDELPREPLRAVSDCWLVPPARGIADLSATWHPDDPSGFPEGARRLPRDFRWRIDSGPGAETTGDASILRVTDDSLGRIDLEFASDRSLENDGWAVSGTLRLELTWQPAPDKDPQTIDSIKLQASQHYQARADRGRAWRIVVLILLAGLLLSYLLICLALSTTFGLTNPSEFWWRHAMLGVERRGGANDYSFSASPVRTLFEGDVEKVEGEPIRWSRSRYKKWYGPKPKPGAERISVTLHRPFRLWLPALLRGPWSEITGGEHALAARPKGRKLSRTETGAVSSTDFDHLIVVGAPRPSLDDSESLAAPVWAASPKFGPRATVDRLNDRDFADLLNEAAERNEPDGGAIHDPGEVPAQPPDEPPVEEADCIPPPPDWAN